LINVVTQARYLVAKGKRDEAIAALLADASMEAIRELDVLDAIDVLGEIAKQTERPFTTARALARRRRFDLLKPLLVTVPSTYLRDRFVAAGVNGALHGLWCAPAVADDAVLIRDWLLPGTLQVPPAKGRAWYERSGCAQMLALLGDVEMARVIVDEFDAALEDAREVERLELLAKLAPIRHALGDDDARKMLDEAQTIFDTVYDEDIDNYGVPFQDMITHASRVVTHLDALVADRALPWRPESAVSHTFTNVWYHSRYGENRVQRERWSNQIEYRLEAGDLAGTFVVFLEAYASDKPHAPYALIEIVHGLPRAKIDAEIANRLIACVGLADSKDARRAVVLALAESGHVELAKSIVTADIDVAPWDELRAGPQTEA
jgi:hypothetical protein